MTLKPPRVKRLEATGPVLVGVVNNNIIRNFQSDTTALVTLPPLRDLARMLHRGDEFLDVYAFELPDETEAK